MTRLFFTILLAIFTAVPLASAQTNIEEPPNAVTVLEDNGAKTERVKVEMTLREKLLARLRDEHRNGNFLDITESDIAALSDEQIEAIYATEELIVSAEAIEQLPKTETEGSETVDASFSLNIPDEKIEKGFFDSAIDKIKENKAAAAAGAAAAGGIGYMLYGRMLAKVETTEEKEARRKRMMNATMHTTNIRALIGNESVSDRDIIITEAENAACSTPASQANRLVQQLHKTAKARSDFFVEAVQNMSDEDVKTAFKKDKGEIISYLSQAAQNHASTYTAAQIEEARAELERKKNGTLKDVLEKRAEIRDPSILAKETPKPAAETKKQSEDQKTPENKSQGVGRVNI